MNGISIRPDAGKTLTDPASLFSAVSGEFALMHWLYLPEGSAFITDGLCEADVEDLDRTVDLATISACRTSLLFKPGILFPALASRIMSDWCEMFGFCHAPDAATLSGLLGRRRGKDRRASINELVDACLVCVDGAYWCAFAHDPALSLLETELGCFDSVVVDRIGLDSFRFL